MILLAVLAISAAEAGQPKTAFASRTDCEVLVEIGRAQVGWGEQGPNQPFVDAGPLADGTLYRQVCDWKALGVGPPTIIEPSHTGPRFAVDKPVYTDGGHTAKTDITLGSWAGPGSQPFIMIRHCVLKRRDGRWRLQNCAPGPIT